jgi:cell division protein FtsW (lipid II flippase)
MRGTQNQFKFLPDQLSDFPFPVFAEDWGFVGGLVLLGLYAFLSIWAVASQVVTSLISIFLVSVSLPLSFSIYSPPPRVIERTFVVISNYS